MKRFILLASVALSISACNSSTMPLVSAPAPLVKTTIDDSALQTAWKSFDVALDAVNLVLDVRPKLIGTPGAKRVANAIDAVSLALTAAESAAAAGSTTDYAVALANSKQALTEFRAALLALKGQ